MSFQWFFNSSEYEEWKGHEEFSQTGLKSELEFLPKSSKDYGSLFCIGENAIGRQEKACVFQVNNWDFQISKFSKFLYFWNSPGSCCFRLCQRGSRPPSLLARLSTRPSPPLKFSVKRVRVSFFFFRNLFFILKLDFTKVTNVPLIVSGFDGGLPANFLLELYDAEKMELKSQVTNKVPIFEVNIICQYL